MGGGAGNSDEGANCELRSEGGVADELFSGGGGGGAPPLLRLAGDEYGAAQFSRAKGVWEDAVCAVGSRGRSKGLSQTRGVSLVREKLLVAKDAKVAREDRKVKPHRRGTEFRGVRRDEMRSGLARLVRQRLQRAHGEVDAGPLPQLGQDCLSGVLVCLVRI